MADRRVVTIGETMGSFYSQQPGPLEQAASMAVGIGGAESNVAIGLSRLGTVATWLGRVGGDSLGRRVVRELRAEAVDVMVVVDPDAPTGLMIKERRTPTTTNVWYHRQGSAGSRLEPADMPAGLIAGAALLHVTGITPSLSSTASEAIFEAIDQAVAAGVPVSFDVNHRSRLWDAETAAPVYRAIAAQADIVFAGVDEARLLVGGSDVAGVDLGVDGLADKIAALGVEHVVIKLGAEGARTRTAGRTVSAAAVPVDVVDTVGAGDGFVAGYLSEFTRGAAVAKCLSTAVAAGAFACTASGDWEALPTRDDLELLVQDRDPVSR